MKHIKYLVNADDFGKSHKINQAIVEEFLAGNITSASLMMKREASDNAVELAKKHNIPVGLHFWLIDNYFSFFFQYFLGIIDPLDIYDDMKYQIEVFIKTGLKLERIDSHLGIHFLPNIWRTMQQLMVAYKITYVRNPIRKLYFNIFNIKRFLHDNIQWCFFKLNSNRFQSLPRMVDRTAKIPKDLEGLEIVAHPGE